MLVPVSGYLDLSYTHAYHEPGMMIYGQDTYKKGKLVQVMLDSDDFVMYRFNKQSGLYEFEAEATKMTRKSFRCYSVASWLYLRC